MHSKQECPGHKAIKLFIYLFILLNEHRQ